MANSEAIPIKYVLFSHYGRDDQKDFETWARNPAADLEGVKFLGDHLKGLAQLLTQSGQEGLLILFYAVGWEDFLTSMAPRLTVEQMEQTSSQLRFAKEVSGRVRRELSQHLELSERVRFVTPVDLYDIFGRIEDWNKIQHLRYWLVGALRPAERMRYDAPKVVEAVIRLRLLGHGVPVFRVDHDVLFSDNNSDNNLNIQCLGLRKEIEECIKEYTKRRENPQILSFIFSGSYNTDELNKPGGWNFEACNKAFATRVFPALKVTDELIQRAKGDWSQCANDAFDAKLVQRFYGFNSITLAVEPSEMGIARLGANPNVSVISGAFLCLSDGAVLDLPPFSNFRLNVSWIDDHLRYALHRELRHLSTEPRAKLDTVKVEKVRDAVKDLPSYVLGNYLPTLLWGTVVDYWIQPEWRLKFRKNNLPEPDQREVEVTRRRRRTGVLTSTLKAALAKGVLTPEAEIDLREALRTNAMDRIREVQQQWSKLYDGGGETFASIWAKGEVHTYFDKLSGRALGLVREGWPQDKRLEDTDLNPFLLKDLGGLIEDAIDYIEWTLNWPTMVQVIRSVEQGTLQMDVLSWRP